MTHMKPQCIYREFWKMRHCRDVRWRVRRIYLFLLTLALAACDSEVPTAVPTRTLSGPTAVRTEIIYPVIPTLSIDDLSLGISEPTAASLPRDAELPPLIMGGEGVPGEVGSVQSIQITAGDGTQLEGDLYSGAPDQRLPGVLLVAPNRAAWGDFPLRLQARGYTVLSMSMRDAPPLGDFISMLSATAQTGTIDPARIVVIAAEAGADLALVGCAGDLLCDGLAMITPIDPTGVGYLQMYLPRPLLVAAAEGDSAFAIADTYRASAPTQIDFQPLTGSERGAALVATSATLADDLIRWASDVFTAAQ